MFSKKNFSRRVDKSTSYPVHDLTDRILVSPLVVL